MIHLRSLFEQCTRPDPDTGRAENPHGRKLFVNSVRHLLGLSDENGKPYIHHKTGRRTFRRTFESGDNKGQPTWTAELISLQEAAMACAGTRYHELFCPDNKQVVHGLAAYHQRCALEHPGDQYAVLEAVGAGVDPSAFSDISAWSGVSSGLLERKILEAFEDPMFIGDELMPIEPTKIPSGQKVIGVSRVPRSAQQRALLRRNPGMPHNRTGVTERYVTLGRYREYGDAVDITQEAAWFDLTGQLLQHAQAVGGALGMAIEFDRIDAFIGVPNSTGITGEYAFKYDNTALNVFSSTAQSYGGNPGTTIGYINDNANNDLIDMTNVKASWLGFVRTTDPETGTRITVMPDTIMVNPARLDAAWLTVLPPMVERRAAPGATQATAGVLNITEGANPVKKYGVERILWSPLVEQRCTDSDGLALSQQVADSYWWHFKSGRFCKYMQLKPLEIQSISGTSYDQIDRGVVISVFAQEWGFPSVWAPWYIQQNRGTP